MSFANSLTAKVILITGATSGIGEATARVLAAMGAETILVGRDPLKTAQVAASIRSATGNEQVSFLTADLSAQAQVRELAAAFVARYDRLDVLINNAGARFSHRQVSPDGIEMTFALNHLSHFLLTHLLLGPLQAGKSGRVVNVSSEAHRGARLNFLDLENSRRYSGSKAFSQSKLANLYFTYGLAATLADTGVTVNALHPGLVATPFHGRGLLSRLLHISAITPEEGALTSIYLASDPAVAGVTGKYFFKNQAIPSSPISYSMDTARKLWDCSQEMTGITPRR